MRKIVATVTLTLFLVGSVVTTVINDHDIANLAGILPTSRFYRFDRQVESLQISITQSEEKLVKLKAEFATERAAEAVVMANEGKETLQKEATDEYIQTLNSATDDLDNAIKAKHDAVQTIDDLNYAYKKSEEIFQTILDKVPAKANSAIKTALDNQNKEITAVNGFYAAKKAAFSMQKELEMAKQELAAAKKTGDAEAIEAAEQKLKYAATLKDELEKLKAAAEFQQEDAN